MNMNMVYLDDLLVGTESFMSIFLPTKSSLKQPLPTEFKVEPTATLPPIVELQLFAVVAERSCCYLSGSLTINKK